MKGMDAIKLVPEIYLGLGIFQKQIGLNVITMVESSEQRKGACGVSFLDGAKDGKHYWLTPPDLMDKLNEEFQFDMDPCPYPLPEGFNGLSLDWGKANYVNPPFGSIIQNGKKIGPTAWARKSILENSKGKTVVMVYPIPKWVLMLLSAGAEVRNLGDVKWHSIEENKAGKGIGQHIAMFILRGEVK